MNYKLTCCHKTKISIKNALKFDLKKYILENPNFTSKKCYNQYIGGAWTFEREEIFNSKWCEDFTNLTGLMVRYADIIYRCKGNNHPLAHIDTLNVIKYGKTCLIPIPMAFNWVLDDDNKSKMIWYKPWWNPENLEEAAGIAEERISSPSELTPKITKYFDSEIDPASLAVMSYKSISHNTLDMVRVNVPHAIEMGDRDRWVVSIRVNYQDVSLLWHECCQNLEHVFE
jgi:hypothetical protein